MAIRSASSLVELTGKSLPPLFVLLLQVLPDLGLCVALFDIERASEGIILHGDGCIYHKSGFIPFTYLLNRHS